jgi:hypothetical protein
MHGFGTAAVDLQVLQMCIDVLLRFEQVTENNHDIRALYGGLTDLANHI